MTKSSVVQHFMVRFMVKDPGGRSCLAEGGGKLGRHGENIRKRNDGRWEGRYKIFDEDKDKSIYRSVYGHTYGEVKEKLSEAKLSRTYCAEKKLLQGSTDRQKKGIETRSVLLFSQVAREWLEEITGKRKHSTYVKYDTVYKIHLAESIGSCQLSPDTAQELQTKIHDHISRENLSESLQKSIFCIVDQILDLANRKYQINIPLLKRTPIKPQQKTIWTLSKTEQARLFRCIYHRPDTSKAAVLLCLYTGLRLGELCALQWSDIDVEGMTLTVNRTVQRIAVAGHIKKTTLLETDPKSESSKRTIPLTAEIVKFLIQLKGDQSYVFGGKKPLEPRTMQYRFKKILKIAKVDDRNFHILRHTFATNCVENCMDVKALSEILGHSDVKVTLNRYIHPTMDLKRKQIGMLPDFYGQFCGQAA